MVNSDIYLIKVENKNGDIYSFDDDFHEVEITGIDRIEQDIFTKPKGIGHGDVVLGSRILAREGEIIAETFFPDENGMKRDKILRFFNIEEEYKLYVQYKGSEKWIPCMIKYIQAPYNKLAANQKFILGIYSPDAYFLSVDEFGKDLAHITANFGFPMCSPIESNDPYVTVGNIFGTYDFTKKAFVANDGETATPPKIIINIKGDVVGLKITNDDTGKFIEISNRITLKKDDVLVIDCKQEMVYLNNQNINRHVSPFSSFFYIAVGGNNISYSAIAGDERISIRVFYNRLYK